MALLRVNSGRISNAMWVALGAAGLVATGLALAFGRSAKITGRTPAERIASIALIADTRPPGAVEVIVEAVTAEEDVRVRRAAVVALNRFADAERRPIIDAATNDPAPSIRAASAATLAYYDDEAAKATLVKMTRQDSHAEVRNAAVRALATRPGVEVTRGLVEVMASDGDPAVAEAARDVACKRLGFRFTTLPDPRDRVAWAQAVATVRRLLVFATPDKSFNPPPEKQP